MSLPGILHKLTFPTPCAIVYRHANNPLSEKEFLKIRAPYGVEWIRRDQPRQLLAAIKNKMAIGLMTDINTRKGGVTAPFLGLDAQCPSGPARLALRFGLPVVPIVSIRKSAGRAHFHVLPPVEPIKTSGTEDTNIASFTSQINSSFEPIIHKYAEQYNWLHARWRAREDSMLWNRKTPLEVMRAARNQSNAPYPALDERVIKKIEERIKTCNF